MLWSVQLLPRQVGPPSEYARTHKNLLCGIATFQLLLCVTSFAEFFDIFGGIALALCVFFGYLSFVHNMNITYVVIWGMLSMVHFIYASIAASILMIIDAVTFQITVLVTHAVICLTSLVAARISWCLFADFEHEEPRDDLLGQAFRRIGLLHEPLEEETVFSKAVPDIVPPGMLSGLFGAFSPPGTGQLQAQGAAAANQGAAQARGGMAAAQAQGQAGYGAVQSGSAGMLGGLFGGFSPPATGDLDAQGRNGMSAAEAQGQATYGAAQAQGQAGLGAAQAQGQAGLASAQGWFAGKQQQVASGSLLSPAMRDPFGVVPPDQQAVRGIQSGINTASTVGAPSMPGSNIARDPFLTGSHH